MIDEIQGMAFPFRIDPETGGVSWMTGAEKIRQNVRLILGTRHGERPMLRDFGSRLHSLVHEPNDAVLADILKNQAQQVLLQWEPRILALQTRVEQTQSDVRVHIAYVHSDAPIRDELTVPIV